jgi:hypothetical protein
MGRPREMNVPSLGIHPSSEPSLGRGPAEIGKIGLWAGDGTSFLVSRSVRGPVFFRSPFSEHAPHPQGRGRPFSKPCIKLAQRLIQDPDVPVETICERLGNSSATLCRQVAPDGSRRK